MKKFMKKLAKKADGFTLVELVIVLAILGILTGIAIPAYSGYLNKANKAADDSQIAIMNTAIGAACSLNGVTPDASGVVIELNDAETALNLFTIGGTDVMADYEALYAGNDIQLKYYEHLAVSAENMVTGEGVR